MRKNLIDMNNSPYEIVYEAMRSQGYSEFETECFLCAFIEEQMMFRKESDAFPDMIVERKSDPKMWS